jgi:hypothetical protein
MSERIARRLFESRRDFPKVRGAPSFTEPTWETIGEAGRKAFIDYANDLNRC